jgi:hypothetical protein
MLERATAFVRSTREIFRRPTKEVLLQKEKVLFSRRAKRDRGEKLARLLRYDEWGEFQAVLDEGIRATENALQTLNARKFLTQEQENQRSLLLERKETYERLRAIPQNADDMLETLSDQIAQDQRSVDECRERLGA